MKKNKSKLYILVVLLISWLSLLFVGKESIKKYLPASIFMSSLVFAENVMAEKLKWWTIPIKLVPNVNGVLPFVLGSFLTGSIWILKLTYRNFFLYLIVNIVVDSFFTYPFYTFFRRLGVWRLIRLSQFQLSLLFFYKSLLMYAFQRYIVEPIRTRDDVKKPVTDIQ